MASNFSSTPAELTLVSQIFAHADPQKLGVITGDVAVRVFGGANLAPTTLGEIWNIADEDNKGWLSKRGVAIAVRLIGWAQKGEKISLASLNKPGPLAKIDGISPLTQQHTGMSLPKSPPPGFPSLTPQDKAKFQNLFLKSGPTNGLLTGEKARDFFVKSKLSNDKLLQIWNLADTQDRGALDSTDFAIGMYFIQGLMSGKISFIPSSLPPGLYQQAGGPPPISAVRSHMSGNSGSFSPVGSSFSQDRGRIHPQQTGQSQLLQPENTGISGQTRSPALPARPIAAQPFGSSPFPPNNNGQLPWDVSQTEKASSDKYFDNLDPQRRGFIEGDVAVPFMLDSKLPGEDLAQVWDLADINNDGRLTRDGFAVAMHLIQKKLGGGDIPGSLPPTLIPPSMRNTVNGTSPFSPASPQFQQEVTHDLFSFDDTPPASATIHPNTGAVPSQQTGPSPSAPPSVLRSVPHDPFASSSFSISPHQDLLGDEDATGTTSPPLHDKSAEIGNAKNQLKSTNQSLESAKNESSTIQQTLAEQASQLSALQTQLSSAKAAYETETKLLAAFKERHSAQSTEIQKAREDLIRAESDLSAIKLEKSEIEGSFLRDKEDIRELHRKMNEVGQQIDALKTDIEKAKKDAKQQKGLLAIAKKQLSLKEAEKAKAEKEQEGALAELAAATKEKEEAEADLAKEGTAIEPKTVERSVSSDSMRFIANQPLPLTPDPSVIALSKSNNPFERLAKSSGNSTPRSQSPFLPFQSPNLSLSSAPSGSVPGAFEPEGQDDDIFTLTHETANGSSVEPSAESQQPAGFKPESNPPAALNSVLSPTTADESDFFSTPPTSATGAQVASPTMAAAQFPSLDEATTNFPALDALPPIQNSQGGLETELGELKELDVDESDSDSDGIPLAELAHSSNKTKTSTTLPKIVEKPITAIGTQDVSFDDIFGSSMPIATDISFPDKSSSVPANAPTTSSPFESATSRSTPLQAKAPTEPVATSITAGINAFDEAMGKIPATAPTNAPQFSFDTAFDDNFDFASAAEASGPPTLPSATEFKVVNGETRKSQFGNMFSTTGNNTLTEEHFTPSQGVTGASSLEPAQPLGPSFDETFSTFELGPKPSLATAEDKTSKPIEPTVPITSPASPISMSPKASISSPQGSNIRSGSPAPGEKSPPQRIASPKPRPSSSSSKEVHEKPPTRHSKLSIRLPFGKKKKHQEPLPPPPASSHLTPMREESDRATTPAVDDDVEPVKQLTAMGFSRSQAIVALEKYGYDVQKALNSLIGQ